MELTPADLSVRRAILETFARGEVPLKSSVATALGVAVETVDASYRALAAVHVIVPDRVTGEVWMAMPFSAVPTEFRVLVGERAVWANCAWDAYWSPFVASDRGGRAASGDHPTVPRAQARVMY